MITIDGYPIDLVEKEQHSLTAEITDWPAEDGIDFSDNIRIKPRELTFEGAVVSDTPIGAIALDDTRIVGEALPLISRDAYARLERTFLARQPIVVVTDFKRYESMGFEELTAPREVKNFGGLVFSAKFKEIRVIKNGRVSVAVPNAGGEKNLGLSLDRLVDGQRILWRKGNPPGLSPSTVPPGVIVGQEIVTEKNRGKKPAKTLHANGKELTHEEYQAFIKDLNRDTTLLTNRGLAKVDQAEQTWKKASEDRISKAEALADYKHDHPGETVDPAMFGFTPGQSTAPKF